MWLWIVGIRFTIPTDIIIMYANSRPENTRIVIDAAAPSTIGLQPTVAIGARGQLAFHIVQFFYIVQF